MLQKSKDRNIFVIYINTKHILCLHKLQFIVIVMLQPCLMPNSEPEYQKLALPTFTVTSPSVNSLLSLSAGT